MLKRNSKICNATKTTKSKELSEKTMGKIVGGINGFDEEEVEEVADSIDSDDFCDFGCASEVVVKDNESIESALRRFKRKCARSGVMQEIRKREHYEKPSVKREKKSMAARKRIKK